MSVMIDASVELNVLIGSYNEVPRLFHLIHSLFHLTLSSEALHTVLEVVGS